MKADPWERLKGFTAARIALGRAGGSLRTDALLDFRMAHALAKDAVHADFDAAGLAVELESLGCRTVLAKSAARSREEYLLRPDLGRMLDEGSRQALEERGAAGGVDLAIVISDGLSATAAMRQTVAVVGSLLPLLVQDGWTLGPVCVVEGGRVAIQDEIGELLGARLSLMLLGERPGLGSPDSLGAYFTWSPRQGRSDAERNCVSNIRPEGLSPVAAAIKLHALLSASRRLGLSGIGLKDEAPLAQLPAQDQGVE
jgi:ethanolamine ammonia-lyase small subunit